jgi:hypothetical protein
MHQLNVPLCDSFTNDMRSIHAKFYEFIMLIKGDIHLSLLSFSKICRLNNQELRINSNMKDVVLYEWISTKFISYFQRYNFLAMNFQSWRTDKYKT